MLSRARIAKKKTKTNGFLPLASLSVIDRGREVGETLRSLEKKKKKKKKKKNVGNKKLSKNMPGMPAATTTIVSQLDALLSSSCYQPITTMTAGDGVSTLTSAAMFDSDGFGPDVTDAPNNGPHPHQHPHQHH